MSRMTGAYSALSTVILFCVLLLISTVCLRATAQTSGEVARVRHAPTISGTVEGGLWLTDAAGTVTSYVYDYQFSDATWPGAVRQTTVAVKDSLGAVLRTTRSLADVQGNTLAEIARRTLPEGGSEEIVTRHSYDKENRLRATFLPDGRVTEIRYSSFGKPEWNIEWRNIADFNAGDLAAAHATHTIFDDRGNAVQIDHADGTRERHHFDAENRHDWSEDALGRRTFTVYDAAGRAVTSITPDDTDGVGDAAPESASDSKLADNPRSQTVYDLVGRVRFQVDPRQVTTEFTYDDHCGCAMRRKQMILHHEGGDLVTSYQYDNAGNVRYVTDPRNNTVETLYDGQGRATRVNYPATDEHPATYSETHYDILGRRVAVTDQEGRTTRYRYDALGRLVEVRQYLDPSLAAGDADFALSPSHAQVLSTTYTYDELGNQLTQSDALGRVTSYRADALGRRLTRTLPKAVGDTAAPTEQLKYDEWGRLWKRTDFAGKTTTFEYDTLGRLKTKTADLTHPSLAYSHATARVEFDYDLAGARVAARTYNKEGLLLYDEATPRDAAGRVQSKTAQGVALSYHYEANGLLKDTVSSSANGVNVAYRYDDLNRLTYVDDGMTGALRTSAYTYNANGSLETVTYANQARHTYTYDALNRLRGLTVATVGGSVYHDYNYKLRASGHRREVLEGNRSTTYTYDALYRLTGENVTGAGAGQGPNRAISYTLDKVGNRLERVSDLDAVPTQSGRTYNARDWLDSDTYDSNGNTASGADALGRRAAQDIYDSENRLIVRQNADGSTINIAYDADGARIGKTFFDQNGVLVRSTSYQVDTNNLTGYAQVLEEVTTTISGPTAGTARVHYTYGSDLLRAVAFSAGTLTSDRWYLYDGGGTVRELTDETGAVTDTYDYDAFGVLVLKTGTTANAYLYRGEQWDADLGLYYNRARYLNTDSGRFWSQDSYEGQIANVSSLHKYLYTAASPVMAADPTGRMALELLGGETVRGHMRAKSAVPTAQQGAKAAYMITSRTLLRTVGIGGSVLVQLVGWMIIAGIQREAQHGCPTITFSKSDPTVDEVALHIEFAQFNWPNVLHRGTDPDFGSDVNREIRESNRDEATGSLPPPTPGQSWDEYPFASTIEGAAPNRSVREVPLMQNTKQGIMLSSFYAVTKRKYGDCFIVQVIK